MYCRAPIDEDRLHLPVLAPPVRTEVGAAAEAAFAELLKGGKYSGTMDYDAVLGIVPLNA